MALSDRAQSIVNKSAKQMVDYTITMSDNRIEQSVSKVTFKFNKPVSEESVKESGFDILAENLVTDNLGIIDNILYTLGLGGKPKNGRISGKVSINISEDLDVDTDNNLGVRLRNGRFISQTNLRSLLELATKKYVIKDMLSPNAGLHYQTGRFANSVKILPVSVNNKTNRLSLYFSYMLYPYQVFDPYYTNRTINTHLASDARNPRRIIGEALGKAARDIIYARYNISIGQGR